MDRASLVQSWSRLFGRFRPWVALLIGIVALAGIGGAIFAAGTSTLRVRLISTDPIPEEAGNATFRVELTDPITDGQVQITVRTVNGTGGNGAAAPADFGAFTQVYTFTNGGPTFYDFTVPIVDDTLDEPNENFSVEMIGLFNTSSTTIFLAQPTTAVIQDNDSPALASITGPVSGSVMENAGVASFTVTLSATSPQPATLSWQLVGIGTDPAAIPPAAGADVAVASGNWVIPSGQLSRTFTIGIIDDLIPENDEQFRVDIIAVQNVDPASNPTAADVDVTIIDNDGPPNVTTNTGLTVLEGASGTIAQANLETTDGEQGPSQLTYTLTGVPANGTLALDASSLSVGATFTQANINANLLSYTHNDSETTADSFSFTVSDGTSSTDPTTFNITVTPVNDAPSFTPGANVEVGEDSGAYNQPWATDLSTGGEVGQTLTFNITDNTNAALFSAGPTIDGTSGNLSFTPALNTTGVATITVVLQDDGGTANGGDDTTDAVTFTITVVGVNDAPSFSGGADVTVLEDAGATTEAAWATAISAGPADEIGQTLTFSVTNNTNAALFSAGPAIDATTGDLTFTPAADANGSADITIVLQDDGGTANGGDDTSAEYTFTITITPVNDAPSFTSGGDVTVAEDSGAYSNPWATDISAGAANESTQTLTFNITDNTNAALFSAGPAIAANGTLTFTPAANTSGSADITVELSDNGGTANGGVDTSAAVTFTITVTGINDAPSFSGGGDVTVLEDAGATTEAAWATAISAGPADESGQTLSFSVLTNTNTLLFSAGPAIDATTGDLTFTPAADANGSADITIVLQDDGGTANGGDDTSAEYTFTITITPVNDAPSFTSGDDVTVAEDSGAYSAAWATAISAGPADESGQTLTFNIIDNTNAALFSAGPALAADGTLTFTPAANTSGSANITVELSDNGGTANGGEDTSDAFVFTITVTGINDAPSFSGGGDVTANEDAGATTEAAWATAISAGPADESGQTLSFSVLTNTNTLLFSAGPAIDATTGDLTFTPAANANGSADITIVLQDDGGTANGGDDTSAEYTFTITITPVNDAPGLPAATPTISTTEDLALTVDIVADLGMNDDLDLESPAAPGGATFPPIQSLTVTTPPTNGAISAIDLTAGTFVYTPNTNFSGADSFTIQVCDLGTPGSACSTLAVDVTVVGINDAPSFSGGADVTVLEDAGATTEAAWATAISAGPADESGQTLTFNVTNNTNAALFSAGPAIDATTGDLTFTPAANANGSADITIVLQDDGGTANGGDDTSAEYTFTITITPVNDAPSFTSGGDVAVAEDSGAYSATWATNISPGAANESAQTLTFNITNNTNAALFSAGPAIATNGTLTFTPTANASGFADITVELRDNGGTANGGDDTSAAVTFRITVTAVNDAPIAVDDTYSVTEDSGLNSFSTGTGLLANDTDLDGISLEVTAVNGSTAAIGTATATTNGTVTVNASGSFDYTPNADFAGEDSFTYTVCDNGTPEQCADGTVTITVTNVNDPPVVATNTGLTVAEGASAMITAAELAASDVDPNDSADQLVYTLLSAPTNGSLIRGATTLSAGATFTQSDIASGNLSYTHNGSETTTDLFRFQVSDGEEVDGTAPNTFTITITPVNDAPVVDANGAAAGIDYSASFTENGPAVAIVDSGLNISDDDSTSLSQMVVTISDLANGSAELLAVDAATATAQSITVNYDAVAGTLTLSGVQPFSNYEAVLATLTYANTADNPGTGRSITIVATDNGTPAASSDPATQITLTIVTDDDAPTLTNNGLTLSEGTEANITPAELEAVDADTAAGDLIFTLSAIPSNGELRLNGVALGVNQSFTQDDINSGRLTYAHNGSETSSDSFNFALADATTTLPAEDFIFTITLVNDQPVLTLTAGTTPYLPGDPAVVIDSGAVVSDEDSADFAGGQLTVALSGGATGDSLSVRNEGTAAGQISVSGNTISFGGVAIATFTPGTSTVPLQVTFNSAAATPAAVQALVRNITFVSSSSTAGVRTATFTVSDGDGGTSPAASKVIGFNQAPIAQDDTAAVLIDSPATAIDVLANDSDPDNDPLTIIAVTQPANGSVLITGSGSGLTYAPNAGFSGTDTFTYTVSDGNGGEDTATVTITIRQNVIFLPLLATAAPANADLVVSFRVAPATPQAGAATEIAVTVTNNGGTAASGFWVDFYINPSKVPAVNEPWNEICSFPVTSCYGLAWFYEGTLAPGASVVLNSAAQSSTNPNGYKVDASIWPGYFTNGTSQLYAYVDSWNRDTSGTVRDPNGAVIEANETNNLSGQAITVTPGQLPASLQSADPRTLPAR